MNANEAHKKWAGKIEIIHRCPINTNNDLALAYTPGVADPCLEIAKNPESSYLYTRRHNLIAVITDGSAVLGLGNIGSLAAMPVMEGKCALFKAFADVDAFPICINSNNVDDIVNTVKMIEGSFGGINLEDISSPRCFEIEKKLKKICNIPVFHDDQHGTAIVCAAAIINALRLAKKDINSVKITINGAGAAAIAVTRLLISLGASNIILCDQSGSLYKNRNRLNEEQILITKITNKNNIQGKLNDIIKDSDIFIGLSAGNTLTKNMVKTMKKDPIIFAMANPIPEILPDDAKDAGALIVGTGRSDFPNQINNVLAFPGIFKGALKCRASDINEEMKKAAVYAIANMVNINELNVDYILPNALNKKVAEYVSNAVIVAAKKSGVAKL